MFLQDFQSNLEKYSQELRVPDERQRNVFFEYLHFVKACYSLEKIDNILEIGSGHSTPLFSTIAKDYGSKFYSVDLDFSRVKKAIQGTQFEQIVDKYCILTKSLSVSVEEFTSYYNSDYISTFMGKDLKEFHKSLETFITLSGDIRKLEKIAIELKIEPTIEELIPSILSSKGFFSNKAIKDIYSFEEQFEVETSFVRNHEKPFHNDFNNSIQTIPSWDVVFFDSGEFSNNIEFEKLAPKIRKGGLAILHDITFPKSFKNFIPCSYILANPREWEIIYLDTTKTPQGLMVAKKC